MSKAFIFSTEVLLAMVVLSTIILFLPTPKVGHDVEKFVLISDIATVAREFGWYDCDKIQREFGYSVGIAKSGRRSCGELSGPSVNVVSSDFVQYTFYLNE